MHPPSHSPVPGLPVVCPDKEIANCWYLAEDPLVFQEINAGFKLVLESLKTVQPRFRKSWAEELIKRVCVSPHCVDFDSVMTSLTIAIEPPSLLDGRIPPADRSIPKLFVRLKHLVGIVLDFRHIIEFDLRSYSNINQSAHLHSILFVDTNSTVGHTRMVYKAHISVEIPDHTSIWPGSFERVRFHPAPLLIFTEIVEVQSQPHEEPLISKFEVVSVAVNRFAKSCFGSLGNSLIMGSSSRIIVPAMISCLARTPRPFMGCSKTSKPSLILYGSFRSLTLHLF